MSINLKKHILSYYQGNYKAHCPENVVTALPATVSDLPLAVLSITLIYFLKSVYVQHPP